MLLKDTAIRAPKPKAKSFKRADEKRLYIEIFPIGTKLWRFKFRFGGKEKRMAFAAYPEISLAKTRSKRDDTATVRWSVLNLLPLA
ncbi:hypothetical protein A8B75_14555 [Sphingomonadales bacterium EhC05]|nr:hypothetical protein A8B75_14555 [Sphingomonadales bacterium EhC05]